MFDLRLVHRLRFLIIAVILVVSVSVLAMSPPSLPAAVPAINPAAIPTEPLPPNTVVEQFVADAGGYATEMAPAPDGRLFYAVKGGYNSGNQWAQVFIVENVSEGLGNLRSTPFVSIHVDTTGERGLIGVTLDPNFISNHYVYVFATIPASDTGTGRPSNRVIRLTEDSATQTAVVGSGVVLLDIQIPASNDSSPYHYGGIIRFGPDGKLYITSGDYEDTSNGQNLSVPMGKILRINPDGSIPTDNPFYNTPGADKRIWAYGVRNPFGIDFDAISHNVLFTNNGPLCDDEVELGQAGGNYAWYNACETWPPGTIKPIYWYTTTIGIVGSEFYYGTIGPWSYGLFWCGYDNGYLYHGTLDATRTKMQSVAIVDLAGTAYCNVSVARGLPSALYFTSGANYTAHNSIWRIRPAWNTKLIFPLVFKYFAGP